MKGRIVLSLVVTAALALTLAPAASAASKRIRPVSHGGRVQVGIGAKKFTYHTASKEKPVVFRVKGPLPVKILSRCLFTDAPGATTYHLRLEIDGVELRTITEKAGISARAAIAGGGKIGSLEKAIVQIPSGDHRVRLFPTEPGARVAVRVFTGTGKRTAAKMVPFAPEKFLQAVRLHAGDLETTLYRFDAVRPIEVPIHGPLHLDIGTRIDFGSSNGYTQAYVIKANLDGRPWKSFALKSRASHTVAYPDLPEITPGVERTIQLDVPSGSHVVSITLDGTTAAAAALRIRVPERELKVGMK